MKACLTIQEKIEAQHQVCLITQKKEEAQAQSSAPHLKKDQAPYPMTQVSKYTHTPS